MKNNRQFVSSSRLASGVASAGESLYRSRRKLASGAAAVLAMVLGYHVFFGTNGILLYEQKRHDSRDLDTQLKQLTQENDRLKSHIDQLQNDPTAIEQQAREELHYTRPGEVIYTLPPLQKPADAKK